MAPCDNNIKTMANTRLTNKQCNISMTRT